MRATLAVLAATSLVAAACQPSDLTTSGGGNNNKMTAQVLASDVSRPTGPAASTATVSGTVTFSGLTVELWDGQQWLAVTNGAAGSATINVGDGTAAATLVPASQIPAGDYTKARISATNAAVDLTVNGQGFSARLGNPTLGPFQIEKTVSVTANADGSRTFSIQFEMIRSVSLAAGANGPVVQFNGDLGGMSVPAATAPGSAGIRAPHHMNPVPINNCGQSLLKFGTPAQRERFLPPALACEEIWCMLFSEPSAGSDAQAIRMTAKRDGDVYWTLGGVVGRPAMA